MADDRANQLMRLKEVTCTLKKQSVELTRWFIARLALFNALAARADADSPEVVSVLDRLVTILKFVGKPNDKWRKEKVIAEYWPPLLADIEALPSA